VKRLVFCIKNFPTAFLRWGILFCNRKQKSPDSVDNCVDEAFAIKQSQKKFFRGKE